MRKLFVVLAVAGMLLAACAEDNPTIGDSSGGATASSGASGATATGASGASGSDTAADCASQNADAFKTPGEVTIATGNPAYPPWWEGGASNDNEFELNDPYKGEGYEGAVAKEITERLGYSFPDDVTFLALAFNESFAPGPKDFDFDMQQISYKSKRDETVDFSESYYDVTQAIVSYKGSPIDGATTLAEVKDAKLGAPVGTTSLDAIENIVQPTQDPAVYDDLAGAVQDLKNGGIDGLVVDLPTAFYVAAVQVPNGVIVGQLQGGEVQEYVGAVFETGSPLVQCVNLALDEMKADGTLDAIAQKWLAEKANAPVLT